MTRYYYEERLKDLYNLRTEVKHVIDINHIQKSIFLSNIEWDIVCIEDELIKLTIKKKKMNVLFVFSIALVAVLAGGILVIKLLK